MRGISKKIAKVSEALWLTMLTLGLVFAFSVPVHAEDSAFQPSVQATTNRMLSAPSLGLQRVTPQQAQQAMKANAAMSTANPDQTALQNAAAIVNQKVAVSTLSGDMPTALFTVAEKKTGVDGAGNTHVRIKQYYQGIPVVGAELIVHMRDGVVYSTTGKYLPTADVSTAPAIDTDAAVQIAIDAALQETEDARLLEDASLVIYNNRLAYYFELEQSGAAWGVWKNYVDAHSGRILLRYNNIQEAAPVEGNGSHATVSGNILAGEGGDLVSMTGFHEDATTNNYFLYNFTDLWLVYDLNNTLSTADDDWEQQATAGWGTTDQSAVSAAYNFSLVQEFVSNPRIPVGTDPPGLGMNSFDGSGAMAQANVHQANPSNGSANYVNAFWDGTDFHFGDGDGVIANSLAILDIAAHEYGHALTDHSSDLIYAWQSGALNEAYSDIFGALVEFAFQDMAADPDNPGAGEADWLLGEDCWLADVATRSLSDPQRMNDPSYYKGTNWHFAYGDNGGVHTNSGVLNKAFYLLAMGGTGTNDGHAYDITGIGIEDAGIIAMDANLFYHTESDSFYDAREAWKLAATANSLSADTVDEVFDAVGVPSYAYTQPPDDAYENIAAQDVTDLGGAIYIADDFELTENQTIHNIAVHIYVGNTNGTTLLNATTLNYYIYNDAGGVPSGNPSEATNTSVWSLSVDPTTDTQVTITETNTGLIHSHVNLSLDSPVDLSTGTYWLVFVPEMDFSLYGQSYWIMSDSNSGSDAQAMDTNNLLGWPSTWTSVTSAPIGRIAAGMAFEVESLTSGVAPPQYTVDFVEGANGSIIGDTSQLIDEGADCTAVTADPDPGYIFQGWTGDYTGTENPLTITNVTDNMTITANFVVASTFTVTFTAGSNGSLTGDTTQTVNHGDDCTPVTAVAHAGYEFNRWTGDYTGIQNPLTITNVTSNMSISADFRVQSSGGGGGGGGGGCFIDAASFPW